MSMLKKFEKGRNFQFSRIRAWRAFQELCESFCKGFSGIRGKTCCSFTIWTAIGKLLGNNRAD